MEMGFLPCSNCSLTAKCHSIKFIKGLDFTMNHINSSGVDSLAEVMRFNVQFTVKDLLNLDLNCY